ncbi:MAG: hypothetical protein OEU92_28260 [Alphaproteobacteria bacterium]|nr:hypothetical protein [Alphaproteobacteria bacterium]
MRQAAFVAMLVLLAMTGPLHAAEDKAREGRQAVTTAKERLVNKAADPQRVNDCKVPAEKRSADRRRSGDCPHLAPATN